MSLVLWPHTFLGQFSAIFGLAIAALALWRGPLPHRLAALGVVANLFLTVSLQDRQTWLDPHHAALAIDGGLFLLLLALTLVYRRAWLGVGAAAQLFPTLTHLSIGLRVNAVIGQAAYHTASMIMTFVMLAALLASVVSEWDRPDPTSAEGSPEP